MDDVLKPNRALCVQGVSKATGYAPVQSTGRSVALTLPGSEYMAAVNDVRNIVNYCGVVGKTGSNVQPLAVDAVDIPGDFASSAGKQLVAELLQPRSCSRHSESRNRNQRNSRISRAPINVSGTTACLFRDPRTNGATGVKQRYKNLLTGTNRTRAGSRVYGFMSASRRAMRTSSVCL